MPPAPTEPPAAALAADRRLLAAVPATAGVLLGFELLTHRQLLYVADSLTAYTALAIAVMGIALGGLWAFRGERRGGALHLAPLAVNLAWSTALCLVGFPVLGRALPLAVPLLLLPYVFGGAILSIAFARLRPSIVYALDMTAAAGAALAVPVGLSFLREEGCHLALAAAAVGVGVLLAGRRARWVHAALALILGALAAANAATGAYNLTEWTGRIVQLDQPLREREHDVPAKVFDHLRKRPRTRILHSLSSLAGRIDVTAWERRTNPLLGPLVRVYENANFIDLVYPFGPERYELDPRIPPLLPPDGAAFVFGTSLEGILKSVRHLGARVYGAEIDRALTELARGPARELSADCYATVEVEFADGRVILAGDERRYDMITLLNTHVSRGESTGRAADAEFAHTREAIELYLSRLSPGGFLNWEEPAYSSMDWRVTTRLVATATAALRRHGATDPARHVIVYQWGDGAYHQVLVSESPWSAERLARFHAWFARLDRIRPGLDGPFRTTAELVWAPGSNVPDGPVARLLTAGVPDESWSAVVSSPLRDERPFPFRFADSHAHLLRAFASVLAVAAVMVLWVFVAARARLRPDRRRDLSRYALAAGVLGAVYLTVEVLFVQHLQLLCGSPARSLVGVLAGMLAFSGAGSWLAPRLSDAARNAALWILPVWLAAIGALLGTRIGDLLALPEPARLALAAVVVAPTALLMGIPLPLLITRGRRLLGDEFGAALFAINGAWSAAGTLAGLFLASAAGLRVSYWFAAALYALVAASLTRGRD